MTHVHSDMTGTVTTSPGLGIIVSMVLLFIAVLLVVSVVRTARNTRRSHDELREIRRLLEVRGDGPSAEV